jgi:hypothetical protein
MRPSIAGERNALTVGEVVFRIRFHERARPRHEFEVGLNGFGGYFDQAGHVLRYPCARTSRGLVHLIAEQRPCPLEIHQRDEAGDW